jgi:hypothetical protein
VESFVGDVGDKNFHGGEELNVKDSRLANGSILQEKISAVTPHSVVERRAAISYTLAHESLRHRSGLRHEFVPVPPS